MQFDSNVKEFLWEFPLLVFPNPRSSRLYVSLSEQILKQSCKIVPQLITERHAYVLCVYMYVRVYVCVYVRVHE